MRILFLILFLLPNVVLGIEKVATDTSVYIMCDGVATEVIYGLHTDRNALFPSTIDGYLRGIDAWIPLGFQELSGSSERIITDPDRITLQLRRWVVMINKALDAHCGAEFPDEAETVMRNIIANRISVINDRFVLSD